MLTELCDYLRNWFTHERYECKNIVIEDGQLLGYSEVLATGQYFRITGSVFNDGVHKYNEDVLWDETFSGSIWPMKIPQAVIALAEDIEKWREKYETVESHAMGPFVSESFAGYSYTKSGTGSGRWQDVFSERLRPFKKL